MDDLEAIKQLKARYCRLMDTKDWEGYRRIFTDDVTMDTTDSGGKVITGADERDGVTWRLKSSTLTRLRMDITPPAT